jgi:hypothetical protein
MAKNKSENWKDLCNAALEAKDPDELLLIVQQLNKALQREEQVRRHFRAVTRHSPQQRPHRREDVASQ